MSEPCRLCDGVGEAPCVRCFGERTEPPLRMKPDQCPWGEHKANVPEQLLGTCCKCAFNVDLMLRKEACPILAYQNRILELKARETAQGDQMRQAHAGLVKVICDHDDQPALSQLIALLLPRAKEAVETT